MRFSGLLVATRPTPHFVPGWATRRKRSLSYFQGPAISSMSLPNLLTLFRLFSAPVFLALFIGSGPDGFLSNVMQPQTGLIACLVVMSLSEISDVLDGILARHLNQVSDFG